MHKNSQDIQEIYSKINKIRHEMTKGENGLVKQLPPSRPQPGMLLFVVRNRLVHNQSASVKIYRDILIWSLSGSPFFEVNCKNE